MIFLIKSYYSILGKEIVHKKIYPTSGLGLKLKEISNKEILPKIPEEIKANLVTDLKKNQVKNLVKMHEKGIKIPGHFFKPDYTIIPEKGCVKHLTIPLRKKGGRNNTGRITVRHRGGGFKRRIRLLDNKRNFDTPQKIVRIEHDPNRSAKIALIQCMESKKLGYILASKGMKPEMILENKDIPIEGVTLEMSKIPSGTPIHNVEIRPQDGGKLVRSAGNCAFIVGRNPEKLKVSVKLPSGKIKEFSNSCRATVGEVSNENWQQRVIGKAGRNRNLGIRPSVRGVAMNAVDHPHGGGKGGKSKGKPSQSPWGKICK
jgi:large subunit ribosomal protein L2